MVRRSDLSVTMLSEALLRARAFSFDKERGSLFAFSSSRAKVLCGNRGSIEHMCGAATVGEAVDTRSGERSLSRLSWIRWFTIVTDGYSVCWLLAMKLRVGLPLLTATPASVPSSENLRT